MTEKHTQPKQQSILIFGGTTEGRILAEQLSLRGYDVTLSVATDYGREVLSEDAAAQLSLLVGKRDGADITRLLTGGHYTACIDATHPHAREVTQNIRTACAHTDTPYTRLIRPASPTVEEAIYVPHLTEACRLLSERITEGGRILFTTGAKELAPLTQFFSGRMEQIYLRILPTEEGMCACRRAGILTSHILTGRGPFSKEENVTCFQSLCISYLVTKDSGASGGFPEKINAARECGVTPVVLQRIREEGSSLEELLVRFAP